MIKNKLFIIFLFLQPMQKGLVLHEYGEKSIPIYQETPIPIPGEGQVLIKIDASTINPGDRRRMRGKYGNNSLPRVVGLEGTGRVISVSDQKLKSWVGRRVSFVDGNEGSWAHYIVCSLSNLIKISQDLPLHIAACGANNPLTVMGMIELYKKFPEKRGIVNTVASSACGRMLTRYCKTIGVPVLNIVRRQEQREILKSDGAEFIVCTADNDWLEQYVQLISKYHFNVMFDCLGGGKILENLILNLQENSIVYVYGNLANEQFTLPHAQALAKGILLTGYMLHIVAMKMTTEEYKQMKRTISKYLSTDFRTDSAVTFRMSQFQDALKVSVQNASYGKVILLPD